MLLSPQNQTVVVQRELLIKNDLSNVIAHSNHIWESFAKQHDQNIDELKLLNQNKLEAGKRIKIYFDLNSDSTTDLDNLVCDFK